MPITIFSEGDILRAWAPVIGPELARELLNALAFSERLDKEEFALVGELALIGEDCYRAWSAEVDTDGAEWREVQWSYTERNEHRTMLLHIGRWDGELVAAAHVRRGPRPADPPAHPGAGGVGAQGRQGRQRRARAGLRADRRGARDAPSPTRIRGRWSGSSRSLPETAREAAAELYWDAFGRLLRPALGRSPRAVAVLADGIDPRRAIAAMDGDELVGVIGLHYDGPRVHAPDGARSLLRHLGVRGVPRLVPLLLFNGRPDAGELRLDGIAVRPRAARRRGSARSSCSEAARRAALLGIDVIRLEVVDTNPRARALYEREGYVAVRTESTPYLRRVMGFGSVTTMERRLA